MIEDRGQAAEDPAPSARTVAPWAVAALDALPTRIALIDGDGCVVGVNAAWRRAYGVPAAPKRVPVDATVGDPATAQRIRTGLQTVLQGSAPEFHAEFAEGERDSAGRPARWSRLLAARLPAGRAGAVVTVEDVTAQRRLEEERIREANHDPVTGLANRRLFALEAERVLASAERRGWRVALLYLDLDRFKEVNDRHGHAFGDATLGLVSARLRAASRSSDLLARFGGDEFVALLADVTEEQAHATVERYRRVVARPLRGHGVVTRVGASCGVAFYPDDGGTLDDLVGRADTRMYRAKAGRGPAAEAAGAVPSGTVVDPIVADADDAP